MVTDLFEYFLKRDDVKGVEHYLSKGRDPDLPLDSGVNPVEMAMLNDSTDSLIALLESGADPCLAQDLDKANGHQD